MSKKVLVGLLLLGCVNANAAQCIQLTSRTTPCPSEKYKGVFNTKTQQRELRCFCMTDIHTIFSTDTTDTQRALNSMELNDILVKHQINLSELKTWLKEELQNIK